MDIYITHILKVWRDMMKIIIKITSWCLVAFMLLSNLVGCGVKEDTFDESASGLYSESLFNGTAFSESEKETNKETQKNNNKAPDNAYATAPNDNATQNIVSTTNSVGGKKVVFNSSSTSSSIVLASNSTAKYKVVSYFTNNADVTAFANDLKTKTGATFTVSTDTATIGGKQIVIGYSSNIRTLAGDFAFKSFTGGAAFVKGETVYISTASTSFLSEILDFFVEQVKVTSGTSYGVPSTLKISWDRCAISENLPFFTTAGTASSPTSKGIYSAGGGNYQQTYLNIYAIDVQNYNNKLISAGYILKQSNTINSNNFYTFVKGDTMVHINWFAKLKQYSIIYGPKTYVLSSSPITNYKKLVKPSITQMALYNTGQSNVIQLEDGSFIIIDGGRAMSSTQTANKDAKLLIDFLNSKKPSSHTKAKVIWMYTHVHSDHINLSRDNFFPTYKNQIDLQLVCLNLPDFNEIENHIASAGWKESNAASAYAKSVDLLHTSIETNFPNADIYTFHTGDKLYFAGCEVEILTTPEDYYLKGFSWINDTSCAFKIKMSGKSFMVFGDCTAPVNDQMVACFGSYLKSDIIQVTHHGVGGATLSSVKPVDADICFWAVKEDTYLNDTRATTGDAHVWLRANTGTNGQRKRSHYNQDYITTIVIPTMTVTKKRCYSGNTDNRKYIG